uniref:Uncharacterized protein n=1 Tax=Siphoviridae sp. ctBtT10 TaxID=2827805 RepID=A0A8S5SY34_9CAUD|nr:MAG TPA: hypothetical protein [Siphoviridae sp. ctBtT10]
MMNIVFYLKNDGKIEVTGCSGNDFTRLIDQFNNGHLMCIKKTCINTREVIFFIGYTI